MASACRLDQRQGSELNQCPERHPLQLQAGCGDILAQVTRCDLEARFREGSKELGGDEVDLSEIGYAGPAAGQITVSDKWARKRRLGADQAIAAIARRALPVADLGQR